MEREEFTAIHSDFTWDVSVVDGAINVVNSPASFDRDRVLERVAAMVLSEDGSGLRPRTACAIIIMEPNNSVRSGSLGLVNSKDL